MTRSRLSGIELLGVLRACLRAHRWLMVGAAVAFAVVAVAVQDAAYDPTARTSLALADPRQDPTLQALGVPAPPMPTGGELLSDAVMATLAESADEDVRTLRPRLRVDQDDGPEQVELLVEAPDMAQARRIADLWATAVINVGNGALQVRFEDAERAVRDQIDTAPTLARRRELRAQIGRLAVAQSSAPAYIRRVSVARPLPRRSPVFAALAGGLIGIVVGAFLGILRDALQRRVRTAPAAGAALASAALPVLPRPDAPANGRVSAARNASIRLGVHAAPTGRKTWALVSPQTTPAVLAAAELLLATLRSDGHSAGGIAWNVDAPPAGFENVAAGIPQFDDVLLEHRERHSLTLVLVPGPSLERAEAVYVDRAADVAVVLLDLPSVVGRDLRAAVAELTATRLVWPLESVGAGDHSVPAEADGPAAAQAELVGDARG